MEIGKIEVTSIGLPHTRTFSGEMNGRDCTFVVFNMDKWYVLYDYLSKPLIAQVALIEPETATYGIIL